MLLQLLCCHFNFVRSLNDVRNALSVHGLWIRLCGSIKFIRQQICCQNIGSLEETSGIAGSIIENTMRQSQEAANRRSLSFSFLLLFIVEM